MSTSSLHPSTEDALPPSTEDAPPPAPDECSLAALMARVSRWQPTAQALAHLPEVVRESCRRVGARQRHEARVTAAEQWLEALWPAAVGPMPTALAQAITAALICVGAPGSACGSAPPSLLYGSPHVGVWVRAIQIALDLRPTHDYGRAAVDEACDCLLISWVGVERGLAIPLSDALAEHLAATLAADEARALLAAVAAGEDPAAVGWTDTHEIHARLIAARRSRATGGAS
jgi:hypothetical protein